MREKSEIVRLIRLGVIGAEELPSPEDAVCAGTTGRF
jgi:hypothetical protein